MSVDPPPPTRPLYCFRRPGPVRDSVDQAGSRVLGIFWIFKFSGPLSGLGLHSVFGVGKLFHAVLFGTSLRDALRGSFSELLRGLQSSPKQASSVSGALLGTVSAGFCEKLCAGNLSIFPVAPQALSPFRMFSDSSLQSASHYLANVLGAGDAAITRGRVDWCTKQCQPFRLFPDTLCSDTCSYAHLPLLLGAGTV